MSNIGGNIHLKVDLDKFYTPTKVAAECINAVDIETYDLVVEPSAGNGAFSKQIQGCCAFDILPESDGIQKKTFSIFTSYLEIIYSL